MNNKQTKWLCLMAVVSSFLFLMNESLGIVLDTPTANLTEKWNTNSSGWNVSGGLSGWTNGSMSVGCPVRLATADGSESYLLWGDSNASYSSFAGNYQSRSIEAISFTGQSVDLKITPIFYIKSVSGVKWRTKLTDIGENGQNLTTNIVQLSYSTNWWSGYSDNLESHFADDKTNIVEIGFDLARGPNDATNAQQFIVDNVKLLGPWGGPFTNGLPIAWVLENGLTNGLATVASDDNDHDGYTNFAEYLAGTDPNDPSSFFKVEIAHNDAGQLVVRWKGNKYVTFDLLEASSLNDPSSFIPKMTNITAESSKEVVVGDDGSASKFYKVMIKANQ